MARRLIWIYCILWVIEGALRKWVIPSLSMPLLLIRDPVVLGVYYYTARARVFPTNAWLTAFWAISALVLLHAGIHVLSGDVTLAVAAFGIRCIVLHMPLIWVVPEVFRREDIVKVGKWVLILSLPLALLMVVQFKVGPYHWLNAATLKGGLQISAAYGRVRPPAVFSFISGPIHFYALCTAFALAGFFVKGLYPRWLVVTAIVATMMAASVSASRGLVLGCVVVLLLGGFAGLRSGGAAGIVVLVLVLGVAMFGLSRFNLLQEGMSAFEQRWVAEDETGGSGGAVVFQRYGGGFAASAFWAGRVPILGKGVGISSNLAAESGLRIAPVEGEWERLVYELGPFTGYFYLGFRVALAAWLFFQGTAALRFGNSLGLLLASACVIDVLNGFTKQTTSLGYICMCAGLALAASKRCGSAREIATEGASEPAQFVPVPVSNVVRGRGPFAVGGGAHPV